MKRALVLIVAVLVSLLCSSCSSAKHVASKMTDISPYSYGLARAKSDVERYLVLLETHRAAIKAGVNVDYTGIDTIRLEIPENPQRVPLTWYNDFKGCVFVVKNTTKNVYLFDKRVDGIPITVDKQLIDAGDFRNVEALKSGRYLLMIEDENPWVENREGHLYGHRRKDILLIENGRSMNSVTMSYNNVYSAPKCSFIVQDSQQLIIKNLTILRDEECTFLTHTLWISGVDGVKISNVSVYTPDNTLMDDRGFRITNCTNVFFEDVHIEGTYSQIGHSGYGIYLNNIWNFKAVRVYGKANWGIFGNNNINTVQIEDSQINRFDIHCYGRDISFKNVEFFDLYNQYSSVYGTIRYDKCTFTNFVPVLNGGSYNAYVGHEVVFNDCIFNATAKKNYLIRMSGLSSNVNTRNELAEKCWPNVRIRNMTVNLMEGVDYFYLFHTKVKGSLPITLNYLSKVDIDGLTVVAAQGKPFKGMALSNVEVKTAEPVECTLQNVEVRETSVDVKSPVSRTKPALLKANMPLKGYKVVMRNVVGIKQ